MRALTANRLVDGEVVFWSHGRWVERFSEAELFDDDGLAGEAEAKGKSQPTVVVAPYLIEVAAVDDGVAPVAYRPLGRSDQSDQTQVRRRHVSV